MLIGWIGLSPNTDYKINIQAVTVPVVSGIRVGRISVTAQVFIAVVTLWIVEK